MTKSSVLINLCESTISLFSFKELDEKKDEIFSDFYSTSGQELPEDSDNFEIQVTKLDEVTRSKRALLSIAKLFFDILPEIIEYQDKMDEAKSSKNIDDFKTNLKLLEDLVIGDFNSINLIRSLKAKRQWKKEDVPHRDQVVHWLTVINTYIKSAYVYLKMMGVSKEVVSSRVARTNSIKLTKLRTSVKNALAVFGD